MIKITLENETIFVSDSAVGASFSVDANLPAMNELGAETGATWLDEFQANNLNVFRGDTMMRGALYAG